MKKILPAFLLFLLLAACSSGPTPSPADSADGRSAQDVAESVLEAAVFTEELESVDAPIALALYGLEEEDVLDCAAYLSTGATAEECAVLIVKDEEAAKAALEGLQTRVNDQLEALEDYQPAEIPKLEKALTGSRPAAEGVLVYLVVADDTAGAAEAIG